jgi:putative membrane protein
MKRLFYIAISLTALTSFEACNDVRRSKNYNERTLIDAVGISLVKNGLESGTAEVSLSKLALKNSQNRNVTDFAKMMITDHTQVGKELTKIANDKQVITTDSLNVEHRQLLDSLANLKGTAFDKAYMQAMVTDHEKAVKLFHDASSNTDKTINKFADKTIPKLEGHLKEAKTLSARLK